MMMTMTKVPKEVTVTFAAARNHPSKPWGYYASSAID